MEEVCVNDSEISIVVKGFYSADELLDRLNGLDDETNDEICRVMKDDYEFIMVSENYGTLFALGSPQMFECNWKISVEYTSEYSKLTVTNFR